jgi:hypothetical protein
MVEMNDATFMRESVLEVKEVDPGCIYWHWAGATLQQGEAFEN